MVQVLGKKAPGHSLQLFSCIHNETRMSHYSRLDSRLSIAFWTCDCCLLTCGPELCQLKSMKPLCCWKIRKKQIYTKQYTFQNIGYCLDIIRKKQQCYDLEFSVLFLFVFVYSLSFIISIIPSSIVSYSCTCVPWSSLCFCVIWARTHPESASALFGYFRNFGIFVNLDSLLLLWNFLLLS